MDEDIPLDCTQALPDDWGADIDQGESSNQPELMAWLEVGGVKHEVFTGENKIGRDPDNCKISIPRKSLSKEHAIVEVASDLHTLADLGSRNKTRIGKRILRPNVQYALHGGETLWFGDVEAKYLIKLKTNADDSGSETDDELDIPVNDSGSDTGSESMLQIDDSTNPVESPELSHKLPGLDISGPAVSEPSTSFNDSYFVPGTQENVKNSTQLRVMSPSVHMKTFIPESPTLSQSTPLPQKTKPSLVPTVATPSSSMKGEVSADGSFFFETSPMIKAKGDPKKNQEEEDYNSDASTDIEDDVATQLFDKDSIDKRTTPTNLKREDENDDDIYNQPTQMFSDKPLPSTNTAKENGKDDDIYNQATQMFTDKPLSPKRNDKDLSMHSTKEDADNTQDVLEAFDDVQPSTSSASEMQNDDYVPTQLFFDEEVPVFKKPLALAPKSKTRMSGSPKPCQRGNELFEKDLYDAPTQLFTDHVDMKSTIPEDDESFEAPTQLFCDDLPAVQTNSNTASRKDNKKSNESDEDDVDDIFDQPTQPYSKDQYQDDEFDCATQLYEAPVNKTSKLNVHRNDDDDVDDDIFNQPTQPYVNHQRKCDDSLEEETQLFDADTVDASKLELLTTKISAFKTPKRVIDCADDDLTPTQVYEPPGSSNLMPNPVDDDDDLVATQLFTSDVCKETTSKFFKEDEIDDDLVSTQIFESSKGNLPTDVGEDDDDLAPTQMYDPQTSSKEKLSPKPADEFDDFTPTQVYHPESIAKGTPRKSIDSDEDLAPTQVYSANKFTPKTPKNKTADDDFLTPTQPYRQTSKPIDDDDEDLMPTQVYDPNSKPVLGKVSTHSFKLQPETSKTPSRNMDDENLLPTQPYVDTRVTEQDATDQEEINEMDYDAPTQPFITVLKAENFKNNVTQCSDKPRRGESAVWDDLDADATQDLDVDMVIGVDDNYVPPAESNKVPEKQTNADIVDVSDNESEASETLLNENSMTDDEIEGMEISGRNKEDTLPQDRKMECTKKLEETMNNVQEENYHSDDSTDIEEEHFKEEDSVVKAQEISHCSRATKESDMSRLELSSDFDTTLKSPPKSSEMSSSIFPSKSLSVSPSKSSSVSPSKSSAVSPSKSSAVSPSKSAAVSPSKSSAVSPSKSSAVSPSKSSAVSPSKSSAVSPSKSSEVSSSKFSAVSPSKSSNVSVSNTTSPLTESKSLPNSSSTPSKSIDKNNASNVETGTNIKMNTTNTSESKSSIERIKEQWRLEMTTRKSSPDLSQDSDDQFETQILDNFDIGFGDTQCTQNLGTSINKKPDDYNDLCSSDSDIDLNDSMVLFDLTPCKTDAPMSKNEKDNAAKRKLDISKRDIHDSDQDNFSGFEESPQKKLRGIRTAINMQNSSEGVKPSTNSEKEAVSSPKGRNLRKGKISLIKSSESTSNKKKQTLESETQKENEEESTTTKSVEKSPVTKTRRSQKQIQEPAVLPIASKEKKDEGEKSFENKLKKDETSRKSLSPQKSRKSSRSSKVSSSKALSEISENAASSSALFEAKSTRSSHKTDEDDSDNNSCESKSSRLSRRTKGKESDNNSCDKKSEKESDNDLCERKSSRSSRRTKGMESDNDPSDRKSSRLSHKTMPEESDYDTSSRDSFLNKEVTVDDIKNTRRFNTRRRNSTSSNQSTMSVESSCSTRSMRSRRSAAPVMETTQSRATRVGRNKNNEKDVITLDNDAVKVETEQSSRSRGKKTAQEKKISSPVKVVARGRRGKSENEDSKVINISGNNRLTSTSKTTEDSATKSKTLKKREADIEEVNKNNKPISTTKSEVSPMPRTSGRPRKGPARFSPDRESQSPVSGVVNANRTSRKRGIDSSEDSQDLFFSSLPKKRGKRNTIFDEEVEINSKQNSKETKNEAQSIAKSPDDFVPPPTRSKRSTARHTLDNSDNKSSTINEKSQQPELPQTSRRGRASIATSQPASQKVKAKVKARLSTIPEKGVIEKEKSNTIVSKSDSKDDSSSLDKNLSSVNDSSEPSSGKSSSKRKSVIPPSHTKEAKTKTLLDVSEESESSQESVRSRGRVQSKESLSLTPKSNRSRGSNQGSPQSKILWSPSQRQLQASNRPRVLFTGYKDAQDEKIVLELGGKVVEAAQACTVLVTTAVKRTCKLLAVMGKGMPIVTPSWLTASKQARNFVNPWEYLVKDVESEKKFGFNLEQSLRSASKYQLFEGLEIHTTKSVKPPPDQMKEIIECSGGQYLDMPPKRYAPQIRVVSCPEDKGSWATLRRVGIPILGTEFILTGLLRHQLLLDDFELK